MKTTVNGTEVEVHFNEEGLELTAEMIEGIEDDLDVGVTEQELLDAEGEEIGYWEVAK